jgi:uncharacterized protein (TIGR01777 family)
MYMTIVLCGGSGFIGTHLSKKLIEKGYKVVCVDVAPPSFTHEHLFYISCDLSKQTVPYDAFEGVDAVINLAGKSIVGKWTEEFKKQIRLSRVNSTINVVQTIENTKQRPPVFINASATGFYGDTKDTIATEQSELGESFLADVVFDWEQEAKKATEYGVRVVCIRTAPVLGTGGFLHVIRSYGMIGFFMKLSKKDFWMSWIHQEDLVNVYLFAIETQTLQGVVNASSPNSVKHSEFMKALSTIFKKPLWGSVSARIMRWKYGDLYDELIRNQQVFPKRLIDKGFSFKYPTLLEALQAIKHYEKNR